MILRPATPDDAATLTECVKDAYAPYAHLDLPPVADWVADDIQNHSVWVAEVDGVVRGGIVLVQGNDAHIANLAVHPNAVGMGVGRALIEKACTAAKAEGFTRISLTTHSQMSGTQAFYRKLGWHSTGQDGQKAYFSREL